jgi:hypothetical protein
VSIDEELEHRHLMSEHERFCLGIPDEHRKVQEMQNDVVIMINLNNNKIFNSYIIGYFNLLVEIYLRSYFYCYQIRRQLPLRSWIVV